MIVKSKVYCTYCLIYDNSSHLDYLYYILHLQFIILDVFDCLLFKPCAHIANF